MQNNLFRSVVFVCILSVAALACGSSTPVPTISPDAISTIVVQTAQAANNNAVTVIPEPTFVEPTAVVLPTSNAQSSGESGNTTSDIQTPNNSSISTAQFPCVPNNPQQTGNVVDIVDGDTIKVKMDADGQTHTIRYIGMDTPEATTSVEPFGPEATVKNLELVSGKNITLIKDVSETDQYGRLLRYVFAGNVFVNYELVIQGFANTASYPPDISCISTFQEAEKKASDSQLGMWAASSLQYVQPTAPAPSNNTSGGANYDKNGDGKVTCADFQTQAAAQQAYNAGYTNLDGNDNDGKACESLP